VSNDSAVSLPPSLSLPRCDKGIGSVIAAADSPHLIAGVEIRAVSLWPDDRGYFLEVMRSGQGLPADYPPSSTQVSAAVSYPGTIKAFHYHLYQRDVWVPVSGMLQVALVDLRVDSLTFGRRNTLYAGILRPGQILIPMGVGHGCKVIGQHPAVLVYVTDQFYNPSDEGRIPYNEESIQYDWETQHK
jgi:dTDP-4-dehydrorhamnose 3,5-epimerase